MTHASTILFLVVDDLGTADLGYTGSQLRTPTLDALAAGLRDFDGAVVVVSHNRAFLQACCTELWVLDGNGLDCREGAFDDQFASYASGVLGGTGGAGVGATAMGNASRRARARRGGGEGPQEGSQGGRRRAADGPDVVCWISVTLCNLPDRGRVLDQ